MISKTLLSQKRQKGGNIMAVKTNYEANGNKYYRVTASFGRDSNGKLIRKSFYGKTKKEAEQKRDEFKNNYNQGLSIKKSNFKQTMKMWLFEVVRVDVKASCFDRYECTFRCHIENAPFAYKDIKDINSIEIQRYYNKMNSSGKTFDTIKRVNKLLKRFFKYCVSEGYILRNPCDNIKIPGINRSEKREVEIFTKEELSIIINHKCDRQIKAIVLVALSTGMRQGEILALKWEDIDFNKKEININKTLSCYVDIIDGKRIMAKKIQPPKTKNSIRTIPLPNSLIPILKNVRKNQLEYKLRLADSYNKENEGYVFLTHTGELLHKSCVNNSWKTYLKNCNLRHLKFHSLRHTYATLQFENNVPLKTVSALLGHSSINITADIYTHVIKKEKEKATDILSVLKMC